jgi:hypothetical protein
MRMGLYGVHFDGNGQRVRVLDDVVGVARRDVDVLTTQSHNRRSALRRCFAEVQADRRIHRLGLAGWLQVNLEHDVRSGLQSPGHPVRQKGCRLSGRPREKVSVRKLRRVCHHAVVAGRRVLTIEVPRRPPWKATPESGEFVGQRHLSDAEIGLIQRWIDGGHLEGDPRDLPPAPRQTLGWQLGTPDLILTMPSYSLSAEGTDVFRTFVLRVPITSVRYVRGLEDVLRW